MLYRPILLYLAFMLIFGITLNAQDITYSWPMLPLGSEGKVVISGFCAFRPFYYQDGVPTESHFHGGIDIPEGTHAEAAVYTISLSFKVKNIGGAEGNKWIKVQHYYDEPDSGSLDSGSIYCHLKDYNTSLQIGGIYTGDWLADGRDLNYDHVHLGYRITSALDDYKNPFWIDSLGITETDKPVLARLYVDCCREGSADVYLWEYLSSNFTEYYDSITSGGYKFYSLGLPEESPNDDWDDPHFLITGNRRVYFVIRMYDAPVSAPYKYELAIDTAITDLSGEGYEAAPSYGVKFDLLDNTDYEKEETVYHKEEPIISNWTYQYYRLYPYDGILPAIIIYTSGIETNQYEQGQHRIRIVAEDYNANKKTADAHFYIKNTFEDHVDFCRSLLDLP